MRDTYDSARFYADLSAALNAQLVPLYQTRFWLLQAPAQGDFLWYYANTQGLFNQGTFDFISARVFPGSFPSLATLSGAGGFPNAYVQLLAAIAYRFSSAEEARIQQLTSAFSALGATIVTDYQGAFGPITQAQFAEARKVCGTLVQTPLDYVISYVFGLLWSGRLQAGDPPLTRQEMAEAGSARGLANMLPLSPPQGANVVEDVWRYLCETSTVASLQSQAQLGSWTVARLMANTQAPTETNGGMALVDPLTGAREPVQVGYSVGRAIGAIQAELSDPARLLTVKVSLSPVSRTTALARVGRRSLRVLPRESLMSFRYGDTVHDLLSVPGASDGITVMIQYPGYTLVPLAANTWQEESASGWFLGSPIAEANANQGKDVTGYHFVSPASGLQPLERGGTFGMLTRLLISGSPIVQLIYPQTVDATFLASMSAGKAGTLTLFAAMCVLGSPRVKYRGSAPVAGRDKRLSVTFRPELAAGVPVMMQRAFSICCTVHNPGASEPAGRSR